MVVGSPPLLHLCASNTTVMRSSLALWLQLFLCKTASRISLCGRFARYSVPNPARIRKGGGRGLGGVRVLHVFCNELSALKESLYYHM